MRRERWAELDRCAGFLDPPKRESQAQGCAQSGYWELLGHRGDAVQAEWRLSDGRNVWERGELLDHHGDTLHSNRRLPDGRNMREYRELLDDHGDALHARHRRLPNG